MKKEVKKEEKKNEIKATIVLIVFCFLMGMGVEYVYFKINNPIDPYERQIAVLQGTNQALKNFATSLAGQLEECKQK